MQILKIHIHTASNVFYVCIWIMSISNKMYKFVGNLFTSLSLSVSRLLSFYSLLFRCLPLFITILSFSLNPFFSLLLPPSSTPLFYPSPLSLQRPPSCSLPASQIYSLCKLQWKLDSRYWLSTAKLSMLETYFS